MGERQNQPFQLSFNASLRVDFQGSRVTSDGGLILLREIDKWSHTGVQQRLVKTRSARELRLLLLVDDIRWELEASGGGTRLTLWHNIDRRFISWGAAGWHICLDVLDRLLSGTPIGRIVAGEAMKFGGWQRLNAEYAKQFGVETPGWPPNAPKC
jgi:hypothetical protein